jgi:hypothetical protein
MSGEGSVYVRIRKSSTHQTGLQVELVLQMTQHTRDEQLLISLIDYFGCGRYRLRKGGAAGDYIVGRFSDLTEKMIPFSPFFLFAPFLPPLYVGGEKKGGKKKMKRIQY